MMLPVSISIVLPLGGEIKFKTMVAGGGSDPCGATGVIRGQQ